MSNPPPRTVRVSFRGNDVDPIEISLLLDSPPTRAAKMGEPVEFLDDQPLAMTGLWELRNNVEGYPGDVGMVIKALFASLTLDMKAWSEVARRYGYGALIYSIPIANPVDGADLPAEIIRAIAHRGLSFNVSVYQDRLTR